jgi:DNA-binding XRE family transcriptional regulator
MTSKEVRRIRKRLGLTQKSFAKKVGASEISVIRWENGHTKMLPLFARQIQKLEKESRGAA